MKKYLIIASVLGIAVTLASCKKKGCTDKTAENYSAGAEKDDGSCEYTTAGNVTLNFTENFAGTAVSSADFDQLNYTNAFGNVLSITKMQYMVSDVQFYKLNGDTIHIDGYHLIDMSDNATASYQLPVAIEATQFKGIGMTFGFDTLDNVDGAYPDLNLASWASPMMLGGGYHQMKFEGRFIDSNTDTTSFQYHSLSTIRQINGTDTTFHANSVNINMPNSFTIGGDATIEIKMDISQWFTGPNVWDLNAAYTMLMPNYAAQIDMAQNASTVFSVGDITQ